MELGLEYFRDPIDGRLDRLLLMPFVWRSRERSRDSARPVLRELDIEARDKPGAVFAVMGEGELREIVPPVAYEEVGAHVVDGGQSRSSASNRLAGGRATSIPAESEAPNWAADASRSVQSSS